jgi:two-component system chemotaxis sensor kinase CheA
MSIKSKLFLVFSLLLVIVVAIVFYSRTEIGASADLISQTYDKPLMASNFARDSLVGFLRLQKSVYQDGYDKTRVDKLYQDVTSSLDVVQERLVSPQSQPMLVKVRALLKQWADQIAAGDRPHAKETAAAFESETDFLIENEFSAAHDFVIDTRAKVDRTNTVLLVMNGMCMLVSLAGGLYLFLSIYRPIRSSIAVSEKIASGHFDNDITVRGSLEFKHLLAALKEMQAKLVLHIEERQKVLNCLGQGFLMFDRNGICTPVYSRSCQTLLEATPPGKNIADILRLDAKDRAKFDRLLKLTFDRRHVDSLDLLASFAPHTYRHSQGMHVRIDYMADPAAGSQSASDNIIVIATDITKQVQAQNLAAEQKNAFESIERVLRDRISFGAFMRRAAEFAETVSGDVGDIDLADLRREAHTLKGGAGEFRLTALAGMLHDFESLLAPAGTTQAADMAQLRRHSTALMQEIASIRAQFTELLGTDVTRLETEGHLDKNAVFGFAGYLASKGLDEARQAYIRRVCMESLQDAFRRFDLQIEELAGRFNKKVLPIQFTGADVPYLADGYQKLFASFGHLFRNIMDHGIEMPEQRLLRGKDESGQVEVKLDLEKNGADRPWLVIDIRDDGAGIDVNRAREKLHAKDPAGNWYKYSDQQVLDRIMTAGLSTREEVSEYSGRGIGLNAVYHEVRKLGGSMAIRSVPGHGTSFSIKVPYVEDVAAATPAC